MPAAVSREAPLYSDLKEKHMPVRSLSVGDTLEYEFHTVIDKAEAPGQFWGADHFTVPGTLIVLAETLTLEVPTDKYVQVWSPNQSPTISNTMDSAPTPGMSPSSCPLPRQYGRSDSTKIHAAQRSRRRRGRPQAPIRRLDHLS